MPAIKNNSEYHKTIVSWRHWLHQHPELSFKEEQTSDFIASILTAYEITHHRGLAGTGIVATIKGTQEGHTIGLRADIDALPLQERNNFSHKSQHDGHMHACGHDGHTAMLLGAAVYLQQHNNFAGTVHFIFQPAEERDGGGRVMVEEGLFELFPCNAIYGMHNWPSLEAGTFAVHDHAVMAAVDTLKIRITGKGGHAAMPDQVIDPILTAAQITTALQSVVSRNVSPLESAVISITVIHAGDASNIIPDEVVMKGTLRYFDSHVGEKVKQRIQQVIEHSCEAMGAKGELRIIAGYPATINTSKHAQECAAAATALVGKRKVQRDLPPSMGAEDFSFLLNACAGAYIWIGNGKGKNEEQGRCMLHNTHYDFNDDIAALGASYWVELVQALLNNNKKNSTILASFINAKK
ncbi:MAG TPA: amidohydrolase [Thiothrix sp.]|nr:amidohydrolase [Thiothrix sp.]